MFDANQLLNALLGAGQPQQGQGQGQAQQAGGAFGNLQNIAGALFGQATQGVREAAQKVDQSTGAGQSLQGMLGQLTGQSPDQLLARAKEIIGNNQMATGAVLGTLGSLLIGTRAGRGLAGSAAKLGGLALLGGLAYKAYQNYQRGQAPADAGNATLLPPPAGSGFGAEAAGGSDAALASLRAMIAAAAADGSVDAAERAIILGAIGKAGLDPEASAFLEQEFARPATVEVLAAMADGPETAVQLYTAARLAIDPDTSAEQGFLKRLADGLGLDAGLVAHVDAVARNAKAGN